MKFRVLIFLLLASYSLKAQFEYYAMDFYTNLAVSDIDTNTHKIGFFSYANHDFEKINANYFNDNILSYRYKAKKWEFGLKTRTFLSPNYSQVSQISDFGPVTIIQDNNRTFSSLIISPSVKAIKKFSGKRLNFYLGLEIGYNFFGEIYSEEYQNKISGNLYYNFEFKNFSLEYFFKLNNLSKPTSFYSEFDDLNYCYPENLYSNSYYRIQYFNDLFEKVNFKIFTRIEYSVLKIISKDFFSYSAGGELKYKKNIFDFEYYKNITETTKIIKCQFYNLFYGYSFGKFNTNLGVIYNRNTELSVDYLSLQGDFKERGLLFYLNIEIKF